MGLPHREQMGCNCSGIEPLDDEQLKAAMEVMAAIVDCRAPWYFEKGHATNAINIPGMGFPLGSEQTAMPTHEAADEAVAATMASLPEDKEAKIVVYGIGDEVVHALKRAGFRDVDHGGESLGRILSVEQALDPAVMAQRREDEETRRKVMNIPEGA